MTATRWAELDRGRQRRLLFRTAITIAIAWALLFGIYYLIPFDNLTGAESVTRLAIGIVIFVAVLAWQLRRVVDAERPGIRAVQALGAAIPLFLVVFAATYLSLAQSSADDFSQPLNHTAALYLAITVFSTVGFGDITPSGDVARIVVSSQMLLDLVLIGTVVRLLSTAAERGHSRSGPDPSNDQDAGRDPAAGS